MIEKYSQLFELNTIYIFDYFDFPLFFISESSEGKLYLNYYIEETEDNYEKWLFSNISKRECENLVGRRISVKSLLDKLFFKKRLYYLNVNQNQLDHNSTLPLELVENENLDEEAFPENDFYVEYDYLSGIELEDVETDLLDSSEFNLILKDDKNSHSIELDFLTNVLDKFRDTLLEFAKSVGEEFLESDYKAVSNLHVYAFKQSSFAVTLRDKSDIFEIPEKSLTNLFEIVEDLNNNNETRIEESIELDGIYSIESIKSLYNLLNIVMMNDYTLNISALSKDDHGEKKVTFNKSSYDKLNILKNLLDKKNEFEAEEIEIIGILTSINTNYNKFRIDVESLKVGGVDKSIDDNFSVSGKMSKELYNLLKSDSPKTFIVPSRIKAKILREKEVTHLDDIIKTNYTLLEYEQFES